MRAIAFSVIASIAVSGCTGYGESSTVHPSWAHYDYNSPDPSYGGYEADRYYRADTRGNPERRLSSDERIYRGHDGRFYCRRGDGSTGLIVGAIAGGVLGEAIAPGRSQPLGAVLGMVAGAAAGQAIDQENGVRCR